MAAIQQQISQLIKGTTGLMGALCLSAATHAQVYVELDVAPWSHSNYINPQADTTIIVAISNSSTADADSADFNATLIDQESIRLGFGKASPLSSWMGDPDNDTNTDSLFSFDIAAADIRCSDDWVGISGQTLAGQQFFGSDWIDTGDCTEQGCHPEREPARLQTPVVTGDSWSRNDGDWWGNTTVIAKDAYRVFAVSGEQLGRHESNVYGRGMVRKIDQHLNNSVSPDSLIVFGGINDSMQGAHAGEAKFAVADIVFKAKQRSDIRDILIIGPGPFGNRASWRTAKQTEHDELLSWLPQFAAAEGLPYLDTYSLVGDPADPRDIRLDYDSGDGAHLNEPGTRRLANAIDALFIKTRLGEPAGAPRVTAQSIEWDVRGAPTIRLSLTLTSSPGIGSSLTRRSSHFPGVFLPRGAGTPKSKSPRWQLSQPDG